MARKTATKTAEQSASAADSFESRIVDSAYECFERYGVAKTTIEDIAKTAKVSRPTVYKYFSGKEAIIDQICVVETLKVNAELRRRLTRQNSFAANLSDALLIIVRIAAENVYLRRIAENVAYASHASDSDSGIHSHYRNLWSRMLQRAFDDGQIAKDLKLDDVVSWLTSAQGMLLVKVDAVPIGDADLLAFIRRFVVEPLLPERAGQI